MAAAVLGRLGELWAQTGVAAAFTAEACDVVVGAPAANTYQITNATKRQWDPATAVLVYDGGVLQTSGYTLEAPVGRIVFDSAPGGLVTVTGAAFGTVQVALVRNWELSVSSQVLEITALGDTVRTYQGDDFPSWSGSFERFYEDDTWAALVADNVTAQGFILKLYEDEPSDRVWAGSVVFTNWSQSTPMELITESVQFQGQGKGYFITDET